MGVISHQLFAVRVGILTGNRIVEGHGFSRAEKVPLRGTGLQPLRLSFRSRTCVSESKSPSREISTAFSFFGTESRNKGALTPICRIWEKAMGLYLTAGEEEYVHRL